MPLNEATKGNAQNDATIAMLHCWDGIGFPPIYHIVPRPKNSILLSFRPKNVFTFVHCLSNKFQMRFYSSIPP